MKKLYTLCLMTTLCMSSLFAQRRECGTTEYIQHRIEQAPALALKIKQARANAKIWSDTHPNSRSGTIHTIPVVVHIVYTNAAENISDAQIHSQIEVLNEDFRRLNADTNNTPAMFDTLAADSEIEFCLATTDPNGLAHSGITRTQGSPGFFGFYDPITDNVKSGSSGKDPWPTDRYLNIWVCQLFPGLLGYATIPGINDDSITSGVVINHQQFGRTGTVVGPQNKGRTCVHEVGHYLGLRHIWGDGDCLQDDGVFDTPRADAQSSGCQPNKNSCIDSPVDYPDMVQNYMDYSDDACMNLFTFGQKQAMIATLNTDRIGLTSSAGCSLVGIEDKLPSDAVNVYPNPSNGNFTFSLETSELKDFEVRIIDSFGKLVYQSFGNRNLQADLSHLSSGIYIASIITEKGSANRKLILK